MLSESYSTIWSALRRSRVRRVVLRALVEASEESMRLSEIAMLSSLPVTEVLGALKGANLQYLTQNSLIKLGLVEELHTKSGRVEVKLYKVTEKGITALREFNKRYGKMFVS